MKQATERPSTRRILRDELVVLLDGLGSQSRLAAALEKSPNWVSNCVRRIERNEALPEFEFPTERSVHHLFFVFCQAEKQLGDGARDWLFMPQLSLENLAPAAAINRGHYQDVLAVLEREFLPEEPAGTEPELRRVTFQEKELKRVHLGEPTEAVPTLAELHRALANKKLDLEGVIYGDRR